jgi:hypothetical protein
MEDTCKLKATSRFGRKEVRQTLYAVLAALLCFIGPTYLVVVMDNIIPYTYAMALGFAIFLVGVILIVRLVKE